MSLQSGSDRIAGRRRNGAMGQKPPWLSLALRPWSTNVPAGDQTRNLRRATAPCPLKLGDSPCRPAFTARASQFSSELIYRRLEAWRRSAARNSGTCDGGLLRSVHNAEAASRSHVQVVIEIDGARRKKTEYRRKLVAHLGKYQITAIGDKGRWNGDGRSLHERSAALRVAPGICFVRILCYLFQAAALPICRESRPPPPPSALRRMAQSSRMPAPRHCSVRRIVPIISGMQTSFNMTGIRFSKIGARRHP